METLALILVILSAISIATHLTLRKWLFNVQGITEYELLILQSGIATILAASWFIFFGSWEALAPKIANNIIFFVALTITIVSNVVIQYADVRATKLGELSFIAPIMAMTPGFVVLSAAIFGEIPSTMGYIGITLIILGVYIHAREGESLKAYLQPLFFWTLFRSTHGLTTDESRKRRALRWAYIGALCATIGLTFDGIVARHGNIALAATIQLLCLTLIFFVLSRTRQSSLLETPFKARVKKFWPQFLGTGICFGLPFILIGIAFRLAPIAYIGALKRISIPLTLLFALFLLGEMHGSKRRFITAGIITIGAIILALDPTPPVLINNFDEYLLKILGT